MMLFAKALNSTLLYLNAISLRYLLDEDDRKRITILLIKKKKPGRPKKISDDEPQPDDLIADALNFQLSPTDDDDF